VWTKSDLKSDVAALPSVTDQPPLKDAPRFRISAQTGAGVEDLKGFIHARLTEIGSRPRDAYLAALAAARNAAGKAAEALARAEEALMARHGEDVVAVELREAVHAFWQAEGVLIRHDAVTEAALDRIFSSFCIGK
jgi:tRNA modification GTPase